MLSQSRMVSSVTSAPTDRRTVAPRLVVVPMFMALATVAVATISTLSMRSGWSRA